MENNRHNTKESYLLIGGKVGIFIFMSFLRALIIWQIHWILQKYSFNKFDLTENVNKNFNITLLLLLYFKYGTPILLLPFCVLI